VGIVSGKRRRKLALKGGTTIAEIDEKAVLAAAQDDRRRS
jgi:hypothetical protein